MSETINVEAIFGENVFNDSVMKERLPKSVYRKLKQITRMAVSWTRRSLTWLPTR